MSEMTQQRSRLHTSASLHNSKKQVKKTSNVQKSAIRDLMLIGTTEHVSAQCFHPMVLPDTTIYNFI